MATVIRTIKTMLPLKAKKSKSRSGRVTVTPLTPQQQAYNQAVSEYNQAISSGDFARAKAAASKIQPVSPTGGLTPEQQQQLDKLQSELRQRELARQAEIKKMRQEAAKKAAGEKIAKFSSQQSTVQPMVQLQPLPYKKAAPGAPTTLTTEQQIRLEDIRRGSTTIPESLKKEIEKPSLPSSPGGPRYVEPQLTGRAAAKKFTVDTWNFLMDKWKDIEATVTGGALGVTGSDTVYLPDEESRKKFIELSDAARYLDVSKGEGTGLIPDIELKFRKDEFKLGAASELRDFIEGQEKKREKDLQKIEEETKRIQKEQEKPYFKKMEYAMEYIPAELEKIASKAPEKITADDVQRYNKLVSDYEKVQEQYPKLYNKLASDIVKLNETIENTNTGTYLSGWDFIKSQERQIREKKKISSPILASDALKGFKTAYDIEKVALAAQVGGAALGKTALGKGIATKLTTQYKWLGGLAPAEILTSPTALGTTAQLTGIYSYKKEFEKSGDIGYSIAAGIGGATAVTALAASATLAAGKQPPRIRQKDFQKLIESKRVGQQGQIIKTTKPDIFKVRFTELRSGGGYDSAIITDYTIKKDGTRLIVLSGKGYLSVFDKTTNQLVRNAEFNIYGSGDKLTGQVFKPDGKAIQVGAEVKDGNIIRDINRLQTMKGRTIIEIGDDIVKNEFIGIGIKNPETYSSFVKDYNPKDVRVKLEWEKGQVLPDKVKIEFKVEKRYGLPKDTIGAEVKETPWGKLSNQLGEARDVDDFTEFLIKNPKQYGATTLDNIDDFTKNLSSGKKTIFDIGKGGMAGRVGGTGLPTRTELMAQPSITLEKALTRKLPPGSIYFTELDKSGGSLFTTFGQASTVPILTQQSSFLPTLIISPTIGALSTLTSLDKRNRLMTPVPSVEGLKPVLSTGVEYSTLLGQDRPTPIPTPTPTPTVTTTITTTPTTPIEPITPPTIVPRPRPPTRPRPQVPFLGFPGLPDFPDKKRKTVYTPYYAEYIPDGEQEFKRIHQKPKTMMSALDTMAEKVDKFRTVVGRVVQGKQIVQDKKKSKSPLDDTKTGYYKRNKYKFRTFTQRNGQKVKLPTGTFVEKEKYRKDSPLEKNVNKKMRFRL